MLVVKVQRPIVPPTGPLLVYDKARKYVQHIPLTPEIDKLLGQDFKGYFNADVDNGMLVLKDRVTAQDW